MKYYNRFLVLSFLICSIIFSCKSYEYKETFLPETAPLAVTNESEAQVIVKRTDNEAGFIGIFIDGNYAGKLGKNQTGYYKLSSNGTHEITAQYDIDFWSNTPYTKQGIPTPPIEFSDSGSFIVKFIGTEYRKNPDLAYVVSLTPNPVARARTVLWESDNEGFIQFSTNTPEYYQTVQLRFFENINDRDTFEIECKKMSGARGFGYGIVFGAPDSDNNKYYLLEISTEGDFFIAKRDGNKRTIIRNWETTEKLHAGYNVINNLKVIRKGSTFTVFLNGIEVYQFMDWEIYGSRIGYYAEIGTKTTEAFPNTPVDVRFRQK